jgi:hypothetical protein
MFVVFRTNAVDDSVGLQKIFLTKQGVHFLVGVISPDDLAGEALSALLVGAAFRGVHLEERAGLRAALVAGVGQ